MESTETRDWPQKNGSNNIDGHGVQSTPVPSSAVDSSDPAEQPLNNNGDRNDNGTGCCTVPKLGSPRPSSPAENGESANCTLMRSNSRPSTDDGNLLSPNTSRSSMSQSQSPTHHHLSPSHRSAPADSLCSLEELDEVGAFFEEHSAAIERWFRERAPNDVVAKLQSITAGDTSKSPKSPHRASVTSDLFQQWLASSPVKVRLYFWWELFGNFKTFHSRLHHDSRHHGEVKKTIQNHHHQHILAYRIEHRANLQVRPASTSCTDGTNDNLWSFRGQRQLSLCRLIECILSCSMSPRVRPQVLLVDSVRFIRTRHRQGTAG